MSLYHASEHAFIHFQTSVNVKFVEYEFTNIFYGVFNNCAIDCIYYSQIVNDQLFKFKNDIYGLVC